MIRIEVDDRSVKAWLAKLERTVSDMTPAMRAIGHFLAESARLRFRDSKAPDGRPWAPLSPVTLALRRRGRGSGSDKPLLNFGILRDSITFRADRRSVTVGTNVIYAAVQQLGARKGAFGQTRRGAPIPWGNIPARPFLGVSHEDRADIVALLRDAIAREARP